ncbi:MAG: type II secretion system minor pseudopilin GspI [Pseudomonadota bacterium]
MRQDGFTLVEVLVSLAIFSLAIVGLNRSATLAVSGTSSLQARIHAGFVADNAVVLARLEPLRDGTERAQAVSGGMEFDVVVETARTEQADFHEMIVRVSARDTDRVLSERRAFRYAGRSPGGVTTETGGGEE